MKMRVRKNRSVRGASAVEFILVMPWFVLVLASIAGLALSIFKAHLAQLKAFGVARKAAVYMANDGWFGKASAPFYPTLKGVEVDFGKQSQMDNFVGFCGDNGDYKLCGK